MSGGVDSSVSAALLKHAGYNVTGVFIKVWQPEGMPCTWKDERRDAMRVAALLDIPFMTLDLEKEYKKEVVDYMIDEYKKGHTPNPDVMCNKEIKFGSFLKKALSLGADFIATGHYAQIKEGILAKSKDLEKDQTYFLWTLTKDQLARTLFPIGHLTKKEVRTFAKKYSLPTFDKKDSQGLCFIGKIEMKDFLKMFVEERPGKVVDSNGREIGHHDGALFYTIGQRHGFTVTLKNADDAPYYVVEKNVDTNVLTVAHEGEESTAVEKLSSTHFDLVDINNSTALIKANKKYQGRIRYRQPLQTCTILKLSDEAIEILFEEGQEAPARGQSIVIYDDELCLGGGVIA